MIISEMQNKLACWSLADKERKFDRLLRLIANGDWLLEAARITLRSKGAKTPGVDGQCRDDMQENLHAELKCLRNTLLDGSYTPMPARRVYTTRH